MRPRFLALLASCLLARPSAAQNAVEAAVAPVPGNLVSGAGAVSAAPSASLTVAPGLLAAPSFAAPALAPALAAPLPLAAPALAPVAAAASAPRAVPAAVEAAAAPAAPLAALKDAGHKLDAAASAGDVSAAPAALDALFERPGAKSGDASAVEAGASVDASPRLGASTPGSARRMPAGVRAAFQKSAIMGGGMAALYAGMWAALHSIAPNATLAQYTILALPLALIPLHFALVSGFWAGRYYFYPRLGDAGKTAFRSAWTGAAAIYPAAALLALGGWTTLLRDQPQALLLFSPVALLAAAEVVHHFVYRITSERRQDDGKSLLDWESRAGGNVGQQLKRMRGRR